MKIMDILDDISQTEPLHKSNPSNGLTTKQATERLQSDGYNELKHKKKKTAISIFFDQYKDVMTMILLVCTAVSVFMGEITEALSIAIIILMNGILGFMQEFKTEKTLENLKKLSSPNSSVLRDGKQTVIPSRELVIGDVVFIKAGDKIPTDGKLLESNSISCDESMLTGEAIEVHKDALSSDHEKQKVYMGCNVTNGNGKFVVTTTGMATKMGEIASMLDNVESEPTPLQRKLMVLSKYIAIACLSVCLVVTLTGILRGEDIFDMLITGVSLAVAAVPEGLTAIVTISLALAVSRMVKRKALVRRLYAVESLGCATVICSDKTGTITQNKMTVTTIFVDNNLTDTSSDFNVNSLFLECAMKCNNAIDNMGNSTDTCLMNFVKSTNYKPTDTKRIAQNPFNSKNKYMSVTVQADDGSKIMYVKGAYDVLVERCDNILVGENSLPINKYTVEQANTSMTTNALRVIALAYKKISPTDDAKSEQNLTLIGLVGIIDPPRKEVKQAVKSCHRAGIKTVMITGDHQQTAIAIAKQVGIYRGGDSSLTGAELDKIPLNQLPEKIKNCTVFARVSPKHKLDIVRAFKKNGEIVAMNGDGINDAPAVKEADIGVSMGITGTDVTKEASEVILLDDNFATLVSAIDEGRSIYSNIRKFIRYLLACNIGEVITMFLGMIIGMPVVLLPLQILLVNLVTDGLPAIALGLEPPDADAMRHPPRKPNENVFSNGLASKIVVRGILIGFVTLMSFISIYRIDGDITTARTSALVALIVTQLIHVFECKSEHNGLFEINYTNNIKLLLAVAFSMGVLLFVVYNGFANEIFSTQPLSLLQILSPILYSLSVPLIIAVVKKKN